MKCLDGIILATFLFYSITSLVTTYFHEIDTEDSQYVAISNYYVMFTHLFIIPCVVIMWKTSWYVFILIFSTIVSIIFHISKIYEWNHTHDF